ncbi:enoyl-CoA hydratase-related protein [Actinomycetospora sp. NBRC 106378]|uniref:enoyl-CoA hydratase/isomerase family protein n=1 Tax=Actinomycetospora sp. NBRC 106378 TaxID=3032208 RepID=UPI0024A5EE49|nr:enoyl-CoA hydratase-related protein [Actinomycetospora sp. NBRC 106378]GLZ53386.1 enoyl-CoA hydratase [Actinomycetospora sp. NBRC 106378]
MSDSPVLLDVDERGVARLRLNRPEASNGLDVPLLRAFYDAVMACHSRPGLRVLVLSGEGRHFCAGGDVKTFASKGEGLPDYLREATSWLQIVVQGLLALPAPVVTKVQGFAAGGGGFGLVCASDLVVAAESASFLGGATRVGMAPDAGTTVTLPALVGLRKALEIALTNPVLTAAEALDLGLLTRVVPDDGLDAAVDELVDRLVDGAPLALAATKRLLWSGLGSRVEAQLPEEARTVSELSGTADSLEGLAAVIERRPPRFVGN